MIARLSWSSESCDLHVPKFSGQLLAEIVLTAAGLLVRGLILHMHNSAKRGGYIPGSDVPPLVFFVFRAPGFRSHFRAPSTIDFDGILEALKSGRGESITIMPLVGDRDMTTQCPLCLYDAPLPGFAGICPQCGKPTRIAVRMIRRGGIL
jgi:hypothetical protein